MIIVVFATTWKQVEDLQGRQIQTEVQQEGEIPVPEVSTPQIEKYEVTAYCPCSLCCGKYANGITATGTIAAEGKTVAADPDVLPYGTRISINGQEYIVEDCGGAIKGKRIDIFFNDHQEALKFGRKIMEVQVYEEN